MKRFLSIFLSILVFSLSAASASEIDVSSLSDSQLIALKTAILGQELARGLVKSVTIPLGTYIVGDDIPAGTYKALPDGYVSSVSVYSDSSLDRSSRLFDESMYEGDPGIGKLVLEEGQYLVIEVGAAVFSLYTGISF